MGSLYHPHKTSYNDAMLRSHRSPWYLIIGIFGISTLAWFSNTYAPDSWQTIMVFFLLLVTIIACALLAVIKNIRHVILMTGGILTILALRSLGLREIIYPLLLVATLISLELVLRKR